MATWIRIAAGSDPADDFTYLNLDTGTQAQVIATVSGPTGFTVEFTTADATSLGSIYGRWDTAPHANEALQLLLRGIDLSATVGEEA